MKAHRQISIVREIGMALAVLAIWMLCLLVPLHQSAGLLRDMAKSGVDISQAWSICVTIAENDEDQANPTPSCPAHAIHKNAGLDTVASALFGPSAHLIGDIGFAPHAQVFDARHKYSAKRPRAPPLQS